MRVVKFSKVFIILFAFLLSFMACRNYIFENGYIYLAEQFEVYSIEQFWNVVYPAWNENLQVFSIADFPQLYYYMVLVTVGKVVGSYKALQLSALALPVFLSFISSFILIEHLLKRLNNFSELCVFTSALLGAFIFTVNPWFAVNARNISFRAEYAFLPLIFHFYIQLLDSGNWRNALYLGIVLA
ncbi:MAG: hypothetical protein QXG01_08220, partial [Candidatus Bathyarchaeia archaeon]